MNIIILAAGQGTRLRPYTSDRPKCMVPLAGKPLLHWQFDALRECGLKDKIVVIGGFKAEGIIAPGARVVINPHYSTTNMVETLFCAREYMVPGEDLLICYGDIVYEPRVIDALVDRSAPVRIAADREWKRLWQLRMTDPLADAETFKMDRKGAVIELGKKTDTYSDVQAQYMGLIFARGDWVGALVDHYDSMDRKKLYDGKDFSNMYMTSFLQDLIDSGWHMQAALVDNGWLEIDTAEELALYQRMHDAGDLDAYCKLNAPGKSRHA